MTPEGNDKILIEQYVSDENLGPQYYYRTTEYPCDEEAGSTLYNCVGGNCEPHANGTYSSLSECESNCGQKPQGKLTVVWNDVDLSGTYSWCEKGFNNPAILNTCPYIQGHNRAETTTYEPLHSFSANMWASSGNTVTERWDIDWEASYEGETHTIYIGF